MRAAVRQQTPEEQVRKIEALEEIRAKFEQVGLLEDAGKISERIDQDKRSFVVDHLHWHGRYTGKVSSEQLWEAYKRADGFGPWDEELERYFQDGLDWSHIRDSSEIGIAMVFDYLAQEIY